MTLRKISTFIASLFGWLLLFWSIVTPAMADNNIIGMRLGSVQIDEKPALRVVVETQAPAIATSSDTRSSALLRLTAQPKNIASVSEEEKRALEDGPTSKGMASLEGWATPVNFKTDNEPRR